MSQSSSTQNQLTTHNLAFHSVCSSLFEKLPTKGSKCLTNYWRKYPVFRTYPVFRLLMPELDTRSYGVKEQKLIRVLKKAWNLTPSYEEYLTQWRRDRKKSADLDFGSVVGDLAEKMMLFQSAKQKSSSGAPPSKTSIHSLNKLLDSMQTAGRDTSKHTELWRRIGLNFSPLEVKWLVRIILKEMKIKMSHQTILKTFHPHALDLYNTCTNLEEVCEKCNDKNFVYSSLSIQVFRCIKPMLATVVPSESKLGKKISTADHVYEPKYDGERIMIHFARQNKKKDQPEQMLTQYFTRNSKDYTNIYSRKFNHVIEKHIKSSACILDGEMMVWSNRLGAFREFGNNRTFALSEDDNHGATHSTNSSPEEQFCYCVFDIVVYNGVDISQKPLSERRKYLQKCVQPKEHVIEIVPQTPLTSEKQALQALKDAVLNRDEGIMIKSTESMYSPGDRKDAWMKLKPDHIDSMGETLDLLIVGGYYGTKFQRNSVSHFLLGVRVAEGIYHTVAKVGSGYTNQELLQLQHSLQPHWKTYQDCSETRRLFANWTPGAGERPDVYLNPEYSKVLEVKANSIVDSTKFKVGYTLRFPRVKRIRDDKNWDDACTLLEFKDLVRSLMNGGDAKRRKRDASVVSFTTDQQSRKRRRMGGGSLEFGASGSGSFSTNDLSQSAGSVNKRSTLITLSHFEDTDTSLVEHRSNILNGKEIYVINADSKFYTKQTLETLIHANGGTKVQNATKNTSFLIAANPEAVKVKNWIRSCKEGISPFDKDVVHYRYLTDCVKENQLLPLHPSYMLYTSKRTEEFFKECIDRYGDAFAVDATCDTLKKIPIERQTAVRVETIEKVNRKYKIQLESTFFRGTTMYIDKYKELEREESEDSVSQLNLIEAYVRMFSGTVSNKLKKCTHIIVDEKDSSRWAQLSKRKRHECVMVRCDWIRECVRRRCVLDTDGFVVG